MAVETELSGRGASRLALRRTGYAALGTRNGNQLRRLLERWSACVDGSGTDPEVDLDGDGAAETL